VCPLSEITTKAPVERLCSQVLHLRPHYDVELCSALLCQAWFAHSFWTQHSSSTQATCAMPCKQHSRWDISVAV
jgi:hypothetical protein